MVITQRQARTVQLRERDNGTMTSTSQHFPLLFTDYVLTAVRSNRTPIRPRTIRKVYSYLQQRLTRCQLEQDNVYSLSELIATVPRWERVRRSYSAPLSC